MESLHRQVLPFLVTVVLTSPPPPSSGVLAMESLHRQVLPFLLRRVKEDVLQDLPPKIIQDYHCDLSPLQVRGCGIGGGGVV